MQGTKFVVGYIRLMTINFLFRLLFTLPSSRGGQIPSPVDIHTTYYTSSWPSWQQQKNLFRLLFTLSSLRRGQIPSPVDIHTTYYILIMTTKICFFYLPHFLLHGGGKYLHQLIFIPPTILSLWPQILFCFVYFSHFLHHNERANSFNSWFIYVFIQPGPI
jgi:hypothetical protein